MRLIKHSFKSLIGDTLLGKIDYWFRRELRNSWGGPFNGQRFRQCIFFDILFYNKIEMIIETGTFRGTTTELFAATTLPVFTAEIHPRFFSFSKTRFTKRTTNIHLYNSDSRAFLRLLANSNIGLNQSIFFYLDAHWEENLPLMEELEIIFDNWHRAIVMIDDFHVPDTDYFYDNYGPGKALTTELIKPIVIKHSLFMYVPALPPDMETGARRGSIILCRENDAQQISTYVRTLRRLDIHYD